MKISVICNDGSPLGVTERSINGEDGRSGVGGAELALLTLCRGWHHKGYEVTLYNNPSEREGSVFPQKSLEEFIPQEDRDILIIFRSPNAKIENAKGKKIWFSCDQYTIGDFKNFANKVDTIVGISEFHSNYFKNIYGIYDMKVIDIPVRCWEYPIQVGKKKNSCIFTSIPSRGLMELLPIWDRIVEQVPDATLKITSDWSLWNGKDASMAISPYKLAWSGKKNVEYLGAVKRSELIKIQSEAEFHLYPCNYDELFCISVAESQVAGAVPITSTVGALDTTNRLGYKINGIPTSKEFQDKFVETFVKLSKSYQPINREDAKVYFGLENILNKWDEVFNV